MRSLAGCATRGSWSKYFGVHSVSSKNPPSPDSFDRILHLHVRKTAGSSLDSAFWALGGPEVEGISKVDAVGKTVTGNGLNFVFHDADLIAKGDYFFASSHIPAYRLRILPGTFTVTILRDPLSRAISYYQYLLWARTHPHAFDVEPFIESLRRESGFLDGRFHHFRRQLSRSRSEHPIRALGLGRRKPKDVSRTFANFLTLTPARHLFTQIHMFSPHMDPSEAADNALACSMICFTETFREDLEHLGSRLGVNLHQKREKSFVEEVELSPREVQLLQARLKPEYEMIDRIRDRLGR
jgi:hypothetical protein